MDGHHRFLAVHTLNRLAKSYGMSEPGRKRLIAGRLLEKEGDKLFRHIEYTANWFEVLCARLLGKKITDKHFELLTIYRWRGVYYITGVKM